MPDTLLMWAECAFGAVFVIGVLLLWRAVIYPPGDAPGRPKGREVPGIIGWIVLLVVVQGLIELSETLAQRELAPFAVKQAYLFASIFVTSWAAGRWGGRFGPAIALGVVVFPVLFLPLSIPLATVPLGSAPHKVVEYATIVWEQVTATLIQAPLAIGCAVVGARWGTMNRGLSRVPARRESDSRSDNPG